jgi:hypothetical protein
VASVVFGRWGTYMSASRRTNMSSRRISHTSLSQVPYDIVVRHISSPSYFFFLESIIVRLGVQNPI